MLGYSLDNVRNAQDDLPVKDAFGVDGTDERNRAIGAAHDDGFNVSAIAEACGLSTSQVSAIINDLANQPEAAFR